MQTLIVNVRLWDGLADAALDGAAVLLDGEQIVWAGHRGDAPAPSSQVETVDGAGGTLLPGLIDAHMHLAMNRGPVLADPVAEVLATAAAALDIGITSVRDLGARDHSVIAGARALALGDGQGPHVVAAG